MRWRNICPFEKFQGGEGVERKTTSRRMNQDPSSSPPAQKFDNCAFDSPFPSLPSDLPYPYPVLPAIFLGSGDVSTCRLNAGQSQLISRRLQFMCTVCVGAPLESRRCPGPMGVRLYIHSCSAPFYGRTLTAVAFRSSFRSASSMMHQTARRPTAPESVSPPSLPSAACVPVMLVESSASLPLMHPTRLECILL